MDNIIEINHLHKSFGDVKAVQDLSFRVKKGELFAFLGVNGAGKSTTINIMCGQLAKDGGSVTICGTDLDSEPDRIKRSLGVVFQGSVLDKELSVRDNLESRAALYGIHGNAFKKRLAKLAQLLDFENLLRRPVGKLSGGQRRRIDIARALLHEPKLMILDEPFVGLDPVASHALKGVMRELCDRGGAIFFSSHVLEVVEKLCDKVAIIKSGRLIASGTTEEVRGDASLEDVFLELEEN